MQVSGSAHAAHERTDWRAVLRRAAGLLAAASGCFALVFWIAAGWPDLDHAERLMLASAALAAATLAAAALARRLSAWAPAAAGFAALLAGALLGVRHEVYQPGADDWFFYLQWALIILPWVLLMRGPFLLVLGAALLNASLFGHLSGRAPSEVWHWFDAPLDGLLWPLLLNAALLALAEGLSARLRDPRRMVRRAVALMLLAWVLAWSWDGALDLSGPWGWAARLPAFAVLVLLYVAYARWRRDLSIVAGAWVTGILVTAHGVGLLGASTDGLLVLALTLLLLALLAFWHLGRLARAWTSAPLPASLWLARLGAVAPVALLFLVWAVMAFDLDSPRSLFLAAAPVGLAGLALDRRGRRPWWRDIGLFAGTVAMAMAVGAVLLLEWPPAVATGLLLLLAAPAYLCARAGVLRFAIAVLGLSAVLWLGWERGLPDGSVSPAALLDEAQAYGARLWWCTVAAILAWLWSLPARHRALWRPLAWAATLVGALPALFAPAVPWRQVFALPGVPYYWVCAILPAALLWAMLQARARLPAMQRGGLALALLAAGLCWAPAPALGFGLVIMLLGLWAAQRLLWGAGGGLVLAAAWL